MSATGVLEQIQQATEAVAAKVGPAVAGIGQGWGQGSAIVIGDGLVLTNAHNVHGQEVPLTFDDGHSVTARVAGIDVDGDLAVLTADTAGASPVEWGDGIVTVGTPVFALANPGGRGLRVTLGQVSSVGQSFRGPVAAGSAGAWSTPRRWPRARRAGRWSTPTAGSSASTPTG